MTDKPCCSRIERIDHQLHSDLNSVLASVIDDGRGNTSCQNTISTMCLAPQKLDTFQEQLNITFRGSLMQHFNTKKKIDGL
jgi:hypothetical protein